MFLHPRLTDIQYSNEYFLASEECTVECINDMISSILPKELSNTHQLQSASNYISHDSLVSLWHCLSEDLVFNSKLDHIIRQWALLLTTDDELFSYSDNYVVPFVPDEELHADGKVYLFPEIVNVLVTLGMPILNTDVVGRNVSPCPHTSEHSKMLHNLLHFHNESDISSQLNEDMVDHLLEYFQSINFHVNPNDCRCLLQLPFCMNMDNKFQTVSNTKVNVWPDNCFPKAGIFKWFHDYSYKTVFILKSWKWYRFYSLMLQINEISSMDVYTKYVFKMFKLLSEDERYEHLMYIRDSICQNGSNLPSKFKESLQALPCIEHDGTVKYISNFCDPYKKIFTFFGMHFKALPPRYHHPTWIHFFSLLGLRTAPTTKEFIYICTLIASGRVPDAPQVSQQLLECLFEEEAWHNDSGFLSQVSTIPFVCAEPVPEVSWIANSYQSPSIKQGNVTVCMTQLSGSATKKHMEILWTVRPIVKLPNDAISRQEILKFLDIITCPAISDVIVNIKNISSRNFQTNCLMPQLCRSLIDVMAENFKYLKDFDRTFQHCNDIGRLPCIPVPANLDRTDYVLVKPNQVMLDESASHFHPYLHALPDELSQFTQYLCALGVAKTVGLKHIRLALELIWKHGSCFDLSSAHIDLNSMIKKLVDKLYSLLKQSDEVSADQLQPLYLPSSIGKLGKSSDLFYHDHSIHMYENVQLLGKQAILFRLPEVCHFTDVELISLLPSDIRPKPLSKHCIERLHPHSAIIQRSVVADKLQSMLKSALFRDAVCAVVKHDASDEVSSKVEAFLKNFQGHVQVYEVEPLIVQLQFGSDAGDELPSISMLIFMQMCSTSCTIYLKAKMARYEVRKVHNEIAMKLIEIMFGGLVELPMQYANMCQHIGVLLETENTEQVKDYLLGLGIRFDGTTCEQDSNLAPVLGAHVPSAWIQHLDQSIDNIYRPEEWVVYEEEGVMILVRILCPILQEGNQLLRRYVVWVSSEDTKEVSYLDLYKIIPIASSAPHMVKQTSSVDLKKTVPIKLNPKLPTQQQIRSFSMNKTLPISTSTQQPTNFKYGCKQNIGLEYVKHELLTVLQACWSLDKEYLKKALQRLYMKWHPLRNCDQADLAKEIFIFLKKQLDIHVQGTANISSSTLGCWYSEWEKNAHSYCSSAQSNQLGLKFNSLCPTPSGNSSEAKRWLSQAEGDFEALVILYNEVATHPDVCCNVCFMAHEVAEKALKAGRYATTGMSSDIIKYHQLLYHAYAIMNEKPEVSQGLASLVTPLESYYLDTRFPNRHGGSIVPKSLYNLHHALDAKEKAANILQIIRNIIDIS